MSFTGMVAALALEHWRPLRLPLPHYQAFVRLAYQLQDRLDGGEKADGVFAWVVAVLPLVALTGLLHALLSSWWNPLGWAFSVGVLYFTTGFKYYSRLAEAIATHLRTGQHAQAWHALQVWRGQVGHDDAPQAGDVPAASEIAGQSIERLFSHSLRQTFGVLFWFALLGPAGAVLYRASSILSRRWLTSSESFRKPACGVFYLLNWIPARLVGLTYAIAGNFEDAMFCWRTQADQREDDEAVVVAAGAGAMGILLHVGSPATEAGLGEEPDADQIDSAVSMIWRGLVVWGMVGLLLSVAGWANA